MKKLISRVLTLLAPITRRMDTQSIDDKTRRRKKKPGLRWPMIAVVPAGILLTQIGFLSNLRHPEPVFNVSEFSASYDGNRADESRSRQAQRETHGRKKTEANHRNEALSNP